MFLVQLLMIEFDNTKIHIFMYFIPQKSNILKIYNTDYRRKNNLNT